MQIVRAFEPADRYKYDFNICRSKNGWAQVDTSQDAPYFGTWANPFELKTVNYCEGDVTVCIAETEAEFAEELRKIKKWNEECGHRFLGIDPGFNEELRARFESMGLADLLH